MMSSADPQAKTLKLDQIRVDGGTQIRAEINDDAVAEYAEARKSGDILPPIIVFFDGSDYWLADGFHRFHSAKRNKAKSIRAEVRTGDRREAILCAVGSNTDHGLRRTNADTRTGRDGKKRRSRPTAQAPPLAILAYKKIDEQLGKLIRTIDLLPEGERHDRLLEMASDFLAELNVRRPAPPPTESPEHLKAIFESAERFDPTLNAVSTVKRQIRELADGLGGDLLQSELNSLERTLDEVRATIKFARPHVVCVYCDGLKSASCQACKGLGWLNEAKAKQAPRALGSTMVDHYERNGSESDQ